MTARNVLDGQPPSQRGLDDIRDCLRRRRRDVAHHSLGSAHARRRALGVKSDRTSPNRSRSVRAAGREMEMGRSVRGTTAAGRRARWSWREAAGGGAAVGLSEQTFYRWKSKCGGMDVPDAKRLKLPDVEHGRLKQMVADLSLDLKAARAVLRKKW